MLLFQEFLVLDLLLRLVLELLDLKKTLVNVITKSGSTAETMSQYMIVKDMMEKELGLDGLEAGLEPAGKVAYIRTSPFSRPGHPGCGRGGAPALRFTAQPDLRRFRHGHEFDTDSRHSCRTEPSDPIFEAGPVPPGLGRTGVDRNEIHCNQNEY